VPVIGWYYYCYYYYYYYYYYYSHYYYSPVEVMSSEYPHPMDPGSTYSHIG